MKSKENLDEFAGMKEVIRFLLKRFPTGDYINAYPESDFDGDGSDSDDQELTAAVAGASDRGRARMAATRRRKHRGSESDYNSAEDEEGDETLDGFIVDDGEEESSDYESSASDASDGALRHGNPTSPLLEKLPLPSRCLYRLTGLFAPL